MAQRIARWKLDEEITGSIPGSINMENDLFYIGSGLNVLASGMNSITLVVIVQGIPYFSTQ